ncbi:MFS transporter [Streptomyces cavourensis]|uniref:MFS transporter n=2 Tax=Streptomyces cavourensis TaxID=67258 RepID=A0AAD0Q0I9_9ACTN|nr:MFS transporter [Streptomyces cavourensis]AXI69842.1 MFS transporter [Streptomyces cavourensis]
MAPRLILISPDFTRLWCGQAVSSLGDMVFSTTLMLWVATVLAGEETWAPAAVSGVLVAGGTAVLVVGPIAGVFVDRWDKRRIMLGTEALRGALVALLTAVAFLPTDALPAGVWLALVYGTVLVLHAAARVFAPARFTIIADLMKGDADRARAAGITQATTQTALILSPPLAAPLFFALGVQWALLFNALSYLVSYLAIRSVRIPEPTKAPLQKDSSSKAVAVEGAPPAEGGGEQDTPAKSGGSGVLAEFVAGLRFFGRSKFLVALLVFAVIGQFGAGALNTLNIFFTTQNLNMPAHLFGYAGMAIGVGGIIGALCAGRVVQWIGARRTTWTGLLVSGALLIAYSRQTSLLGGLALPVLFTIPITMLNTAMAPLLLTAASPAYRGRVVAVFQPMTQVASMLAAALSGWLAGTVLSGFEGSVAGIGFGPIDMILAVAGLVILLSGFYARLALPETQTAGPAQEEAGEAGKTTAEGTDAAATAVRPGPGRDRTQAPPLLPCAGGNRPAAGPTPGPDSRLTRGFPLRTR